MNGFERKLRKLGYEGLHADWTNAIQLNLGLRCNLSCAHCHLQAHPERTEVMSDEVLKAVYERVAVRPGLFFDLTGGSWQTCGRSLYRASSPWTA